MWGEVGGGGGGGGGGGVCGMYTGITWPVTASCVFIKKNHVQKCGGGGGANRMAHSLQKVGRQLPELAYSMAFSPTAWPSRLLYIA